MPAIASPSKKEKSGKKSRRQGAQTAPEYSGLIQLLLLAVCGAILGLSAPGLDQWYLAWVGLVPLLLAVSSATGLKQAFARGLVFGMGYMLVALSWYLLGLPPLDWLGYNSWQGWSLATLAWLVNAAHQALIIALFAVAMKLTPMAGNFTIKKSQSQWRIPVMLAIPLLWVLIVNKIGNAHCALGVPWAMIEYSQYRELFFIQCASVIGSIGIGFLIVLANTALATLLATVWKKRNFASLVAAGKEHALYQAMFVGVVLVAATACGYYCSLADKVPATIDASVLQGNINIDMQKTTRRYSLEELYTHYATMLAECPSGLCVFTESALPCYLRGEHSVINALADNARSHHVDMVIGAIDDDYKGNPYNSAFGITQQGAFLQEAYHKRYLVPFGEYAPYVVQHYFPEWIKRLTNTPAGGGFSSGKSPVTLDFDSARIAPLICFECLSPEVVASSVRHGGQVLVNISDLAWFHRSIIGRQMLAFSVFRAIENGRYFIFAANTGPSAIIDPGGRIRQLSQLDRSTVLVGKVGPSSKLTPFTQWFVF